MRSNVHPMQIGVKSFRGRNDRLALVLAERASDAYHARTMPPRKPQPDKLIRLTTTFPAQLRELAGERALAVGAPSFAAYLVNLVRTDLEAGGIALPLPPPPKRNGVPKRTVKKGEGDRR